jgi:hypothetical protein
MSTGELSSRPADATSSSRAAPVIVLAYPGSGAVRLQSLLSAFPGMACTNGTGIVPLRGQALTVWQAVDGRSGEGVLAARRRACQGLHRRPVDRDPGPRRRRPLVRAHLRAPGGGRGVRAALPAGPVPDRAPPGRRGGARHPRREPLGPVGPGIRAVRARAPSKHPAALASYWAARTSQQLEFEQQHPGSCQRVRIEDLTADPAQATLGYPPVAPA